MSNKSKIPNKNSEEKLPSSNKTTQKQDPIKENDVEEEEEEIEEKPSQQQSKEVSKKKKKKKKKKKSGNNTEKKGNNGSEIIVEQKNLLDEKRSKEVQIPTLKVFSKMTIQVTDYSEKIKGEGLFGFTVPNTREKVTKPRKSQTTPPTIPILELFSKEKLPIGQIMEYDQDFNTWRSTMPNKESKDSKFEPLLKEAREGAEVHRQVRKYIQNFIRPGMRVIDICEEIENRVRILIKAKGIEAGLAFPTGFNINHCAAHYTSNPGDETILRYDDVVSIDIGTHVNGTIIDSAFTLCWNEKFLPLLIASREGTEAGIKAMGVDVRLGDVGAAIEEVISSYEITLDGKVYGIKPIRNLSGHSLGRYHIHAGNTVPIVKSEDNTKIKEYELYAIETFATTGNGNVVDSGTTSHFMKDFYAPQAKTLNWKDVRAVELLKTIENNFSTMAFCRRYLERLGEKKYLLALKNLIDKQYVVECPPLSDKNNSYTTQFEHTVALFPSKKEVISRGEDY